MNTIFIKKSIGGGCFFNLFMPIAAKVDNQAIFRPLHLCLAALVWLFCAVPNANAAVPPAPVLRTPSGQVSDVTPTYTWTSVIRATSYQLMVIDNSGRSISQKFQPAKNCNAAKNLCSASPNIVLAPGNALWRVRAGNAEGWGLWSKSLQITVKPAAKSVQNVLEIGDRYVYFAEPIVGGLLFTDMWRVLNENNAPCWISTATRFTQYQFYKDPTFLPGPLYRYNGTDVSVGQVTVYTIGWYFRPGQTKPLRAAYVNAGLGDVFWVIVDNDTFVETFWHNSSFLVVTTFNIGNQCL